MTGSRIVVVEGPDVGAEFELPPQGGGIGRGVDNVVQLADLSVSRCHCTIEARGDKLVVLDPGSRNRTLVNGKPIVEHVLAEGDEICVGSTRLVYLPTQARSQGAGHRVTVETIATQLLKAGGTSGPARAKNRGYLGALYQLGEGIRRAADTSAVAKAACEAVGQALGTTQVAAFLPDRSGDLAPAASLGEGFGIVKAVPRELLGKIFREGKALLLDEKDGSQVAAAPLKPPVEQGDVSGVLCARRTGATSPWSSDELELVACVAHLSGAAAAGVALSDALSRENRSLEERLGAATEFIGTSPAARSLHDFVSRVGRADSTVLVLGESGAGKELIASAIHRSSRRAREPFVCVNCAALSESIIESELFGHERGAFTGAVEAKAGRFELAHGGTLFLDEVGEIPLRSQAKFLRVLEERRLERVGGARSMQVDVRVVAATNRDLEQMVERGEFRSDLYFRLSVIQTHIPALRERPEDIPAIAEHLLRRLRSQMGRRRVSLSSEAIDALRSYAWPGNVRQLRNALEHAVVLTDADVIGAADLPPYVLGRQAGASRAAPLRAGSPSVEGAPRAAAAPGARSLRELEREGILAALAATGGNKAQAAALLEIDRSTLYKKLKDYGIASD